MRKVVSRSPPVDPLTGLQRRLHDASDLGAYAAHGFMEGMWSALLRAELQRRSRGGQVQRLRAWWALSLFGILAGLYAVATLAWHLPEEQVGTFILNQLRDGQLLIGCVVGAAVGAAGTTRDRERGALDLVALTRMGATQRWLERSLAQQVGLVGLVAIGAPALALCVAFGGVSPSEVFLVFTTSILTIPVVGAVGSTLALATDKALWAWLGAMAWGYAVFIALPWHLSVPWASRVGPWGPFGAYDVQQAGKLSPLWAGALSADLWESVWIGVVLFVVVILRGGLRLGRMTGARGRPFVAGTLAALLILSATGLHSLAHGWALSTFEAGVLLVATAWLLLDGLMAVLALRSSRRRRWRIGAWLDQELRARSHGGASVLGWWAAGGIGLLLLQGWWSLPSVSTRNDILPWSDAAAIIGLALIVMSCLLTTAEDRIRGGALAMAPGGPRRLLAYRLLGVAARTLPFLALSAVLRDVWLLAWVPSVWLLIAMASLGIGWAVRRPGLAWAIALGGAFAAAVGLGQATMWGTTGVRVQQAFAPLIAVRPAPWPWIVASGAAYAGIGLLVGGIISIRLRRWLSRK